MPQNLIDKVVKKCNIDREEVEDKWEEAKNKAESQGHKEDWGYITSIFKSMVGKDCAKKLGWRNEMKITEKIDKYLNESTEEDKFIKITADALATEIETKIENMLVDNKYLEQAEKEHGGDLDISESDIAKLINLAIKKVRTKNIIKNVVQHIGKIR